MRITNLTHNIFVATYLLACIVYYVNICGAYEYVVYYLGIGTMIILSLLYSLVQHNIKKVFKYIIVSVVFFMICRAIMKQYIYPYNGVSIIRLAKIESVLRGESYKPGSSKVRYTDYDSSRTVKIYKLSKKSVGTNIYVIHPLECSSPVFKEYKDTVNYPLIHDFAFLDNKDFYTYHDFSLIKPDLVYYQVGFNVLYNAVCDTSAIADSTAFLSFDDVCGKNQIVKYSVKGYPNIPDTFLVYRNVNEKLDSVWHVCAPEVNTPENRAKISDYGYIFHYDVYSKQEIESQCPRIKEYVEQYKKRMTPPTN